MNKIDSISLLNERFFDVYYKDYLDKINEITQLPYKDYLRSSSAGTCVRKQWYSWNKFEETEPMEARNGRVVRLGTIVHTEIENFIKNQLNVMDELSDWEFIPEFEFKDNVNNITGHIDLVIRNKKTEKVYIYDWKTIGRFSLYYKQNPHKAKNIHYSHEYQLGTYGHYIRDAFKDCSGMFLGYYNKDTSEIWIKEVYLDWIDEAKIWWNEAKGMILDTKMPEMGELTPMTQNECGYC